jgi:steroid delta-isomerase-like uncharacterized protein
VTEIVGRELHPPDVRSMKTLGREDAMTGQIQTPAEVARAIFDAVGKKQLDDAMAYVAEDAVDDFVAIGRFEGKAAIRGFFEGLFTAFPTFDMAVERIVGDDASAVVQWKASGDFTGGPFQGVEPTGKYVEIRGVDVMEIADGMVRHNTIYYDGAAFARQVGMLPRAGTTMDRAVLSTFNAATRLRKRFGQDK